jgi:hypothetical protein
MAPDSMRNLGFQDDPATDKDVVAAQAASAAQKAAAAAAAAGTNERSTK